MSVPPCRAQTPGGTQSCVDSYESCLVPAASAQQNGRRVATQPTHNELTTTAAVHAASFLSPRLHGHPQEGPAMFSITQPNRRDRSGPRQRRPAAGRWLPLLTLLVALSSPTVAGAASGRG